MSSFGAIRLFLNFFSFFLFLLGRVALSSPVVRHHRVDAGTRLPTAAGAAGCWTRLPAAVEAVRRRIASSSGSRGCRIQAVCHSRAAAASSSLRRPGVLVQIRETAC
ncbi:hypothetical protein ABZP36_030857 [Zizania latifolia]